MALMKWHRPQSAPRPAILALASFLLLLVCVPVLGASLPAAERNQAGPIFPQSAWLSGWKYRKAHGLLGAPGAETRYVITVKVHRSIGTDQGEDVYVASRCRPDFGDIRFTDDDGHTQLVFWLEEKRDGVDAVFRVRISDNLESDQRLFVYFGKDSAVSTSTGAATFPDFFGDFEQSTQTRAYATVAEDGLIRNNSGSRIPEATFFDTRFGVLHHVGWYDRTYIVYADVNSDAMITYFDHATGTFAAPVNLGESAPRRDPHCNPRLTIDADGYLYVFWGSHNSNQLMRRSVSPETIDSWDDTKMMLGRYTYPQVFLLGNTMYWFYRRWYDTWVYRTSTDYQGDWTWSDEHVVIDEPGSQVPYPIFMRGDEPRTPRIHVAWNVYDGTLWRDVYYACSDDGGTTWKTRAGAPLSLPLSQNSADSVYTFPYLHGWVDDLQLTSEHEPVILFMEGDDGSVPNLVKIAKFQGGAWTTHTVTDAAVSRYNLPAMRVESAGLMRVYAPIGGDPNGNIPGCYGGEIREFTSSDGGDTWVNTRGLTHDSPYLHCHVMTARESDTYRPVVNQELQLVWSYGLAGSAKVLAWGPRLGKTTEHVYNRLGESPARWRYNSDCSFGVAADGHSGQGAVFQQNSFSEQSGYAYHTIHPIVSDNDRAFEVRVKIASNVPETCYYVTFYDVDHAGPIGPMIGFRDNGTVSYQDAGGVWQPLQGYVKDEWYALKISNIDLTRDQFDIDINGIRKGTDCAFRTAADELTRVGIGGMQDYPNTVAVSDNYIVRTCVDPEPAHGYWGRQEMQGAARDAIRAALLSREFGRGPAGVRVEVPDGKLVDSLAVWIRAGSDSLRASLADALLLEGQCRVAVEADSAWAGIDSTGLDLVQFAAVDTLGSATLVMKGAHRPMHGDVDNPNSAARFVVASNSDQLLNVGLLHRTEGGALTFVRYPALMVTGRSRIAVAVVDSVAVPALEVDEDGDGTVDFLMVPEAAGVEDGSRLPGAGDAPLSLLAAPNPTAGATTLVLRAAVALRDVRVSIYDVAGREVRHVAVGDLSPGVHTIAWDGRTDDGRQAASGIYQCMATYDGRGKAVRRLVVLR